MEIPTRPDFLEYEPRLYKFWEEQGFFTPQIDKDKEPFTIILPPPNANAPLHIGHAMYTVEDILVRYHRMKGDPTLWLPGADHAGFETQVVFEKHLAAKSQSRFDFDRNTLYQMIWDFVEENKGIMENQLRRLGFSLDWTRFRYTLSPDIVKTINQTFKKLHLDDLIYRDNRIVNYCPHCGTTFSDLEVKHTIKKDPLYYLKYGPFVLATTRPETKFGDTAVAVNPKDERYQHWIGKEIEAQGILGNFKLLVIADEAVDPAFGTGVVKVTPAHDPTDFEISRRHNLEVKQIINLDGTLNEKTGPYQGLKINEARKLIVEDLQKRGLVDHIDEAYEHSVGICYKCGFRIEPNILPNWFLRMDGFAKQVAGVFQNKKIGIYPEHYSKILYNWLENIRDWPISRQIVWGIRIPAFYCFDCNPNLQISFINQKGGKVVGLSSNLKDFSFAEIKNGLQTLIAPIDSFWIMDLQPEATCPKCNGKNFLQDTDSFDTWFSSGQWPLVTLGYPKSEDFEYFYPTSVLETGYDIIFFWVARMVLFSLYLTGDAPFKNVYLHGMVKDKWGQKMSKSKGNVINPMETVEQYGADSLRMALVVGNGPGNDLALREEKIIGYRNFVTKLWNINRFFLSRTNNLSDLRELTDLNDLQVEDQDILGKTDQTVATVTKALDSFQISQAGEAIYNFIWHELADSYLEKIKPRLLSPDQKTQAVFYKVWLTSLKLLHPFMPFVTEEIYQLMGLSLPKKEKSLMISLWPQTEKA